MARPTTVHWHVLSSIREAADVEGIKIDVKVCADMEHPRISDDGVAEKNRGRHEVRQPGGRKVGCGDANGCFAGNSKIGWV